MGYEMLIGPEDAETETHYLGSGTDVDDFVKWVKTLPETGFPLLKQFADDFQTTDGSALADEIIEATVDHPPATPGVAETAHEIGKTCDGLSVGELFRIAS